MNIYSYKYNLYNKISNNCNFCRQLIFIDKLTLSASL